MSHRILSFGLIALNWVERNIAYQSVYFNGGLLQIDMTFIVNLIMFWFLVSFVKSFSVEFCCIEDCMNVLVWWVNNLLLFGMADWVSSLMIFPSRLCQDIRDIAYMFHVLQNMQKLPLLIRTCFNKTSQWIFIK